MARQQRQHPQVEYHVGSRVYPTFDEAAGYALAIALGKGTSEIDVVIYSESGARFYGGDEAVEVYQADPEASVHERIEIAANMLGKVA